MTITMDLLGAVISLSLFIMFLMYIASWLLALAALMIWEVVNVMNYNSGATARKNRIEARKGRSTYMETWSEREQRLEDESHHL